MAFNTQAHRVSKVIVTKEQTATNSRTGKLFAYRDIIIVFDDGTEQTIDLFSAESVDNITVEVR